MLKRLWRALRAAIAALIWLYIITKLFIYDIDVFLFEKFLPSYKYLLSYKFFGLIFILVICWQVFGIWKVANFIGYVVALPAKWLGWKLPLALYARRGSLFAVLYFNNFFSIVRRSRSLILQSSVALFAFFIVLTSNNHYILYTAIVMIFSQLIFHYLGRVSLISQPLSYIFITPEEIQSILDSDISGSDAETEETRASKVTVLLGSLATLRLLKDGLRKFTQKSIYSFYILTYIVTTYFVALFDIALINIALYKIDHSQYRISNSSIVSWLIYSGSSMAFNGSADITYVNTYSRLVFLSSALFGVLFLALLIGVVSGILTERNKEGLESYIVKLDEYDESLTQKAISQYQLNIDDVTHRVKEMNKQFGVAVKKFETFVGKQKKQGKLSQKASKAK